MRVTRTTIGAAAAQASAFLALAWIAGLASATEPLPTPAKPAAKAAAKAAPEAVPVKPQAAGATPEKSQPDAERPKQSPDDKKTDANEKADKDAKKSDAPPEAVPARRRPLIAPPGLLSQSPSVAKFSRPGLGKLNLNTATIEQLQRLPGVGLVWAPRILAGRPYRTFGELARDGIPYTVIQQLSQDAELGP